MKKLLLFSAAILCALTSSIAQCGGGTGVDGAYTATANTTLAGGTYNYTTFNIDPGVTVGVTGTQPLIIYCTGAVTINGTLTAAGQNGVDGITYVSGGIGGLAVAGGGNGGDGTFASGSGPLNGFDGTGTGGANTMGAGWSGGGGAGYSAAGLSSGGVGGFGGAAYGTIQITAMDAGSGGGGGSGGYDCGAGGGGGGGGFIKIQSGTSITIAGAINVNGGNGGSDGTGNCGGGGGGSGGSIWLSAPTMTNNGMLTANGGTGGASNVPGTPYYGDGGNGAAGRIRLDYNPPITGSGSASPAVGYSQTITVMSSAMATTDEMCFGGSTGTAVVTYQNGTGPVTYTWTPSGPNNSFQSGLGAGNYSCLVTDQNGCTTTATGTITQPTQLQVTVGVMNATCFGSCDGSLFTSASGGTPGYSYIWMPGGQTTSSINNLCAGCYTLTLTDANGCDTTVVTCITEPPAPPTNLLGNDTIICSSDMFSLCAPGGFTAYLWNTSATTMCVSADSNFCYSVQMVNAMGCVTRDTLCVTETPCLGIEEITSEGNMIFPNPANDIITIHHGGSTAQKVQVFNSEGKLCLVKTVADNGELNVSELADGVYVVLINNTQHRLVIAR